MLQRGRGKKQDQKEGCGNIGRSPSLLGRQRHLTPRDGEAEAVGAPHSEAGVRFRAKRDASCTPVHLPPHSHLVHSDTLNDKLVDFLTGCSVV